MDISLAYTLVKKRIRKACRQHGRKDATVQLIAASKGQSVERIAELHKLGQIHFGENYVSELLAKVPQLPNTIVWSYIGQLQSNKIRRIMMHASEIQSVTSLKHVRLIAQYAEELQRVPYPIFLEVKVPNDETKGGLEYGEIQPLVEKISEQYPQIALQGIMVVPPQEFAEEWSDEAERVYKELRELANEVGEGRLSLGMSSDLEQAIEFGSNVVRIGTALMGSRSLKSND